MVFGLVGLEGLDGSETSDSEIKQKSLGSGSIQDEWRSSKMAKNGGLSSSETMPLHHGIPLLRSKCLETGQNELMLSFSSGSEASLLTNNGGVVKKATHQSLLPYFHQKPPFYSKNSGYGDQNGRVHGGKGPFTPSQWIELEHQALIYKYITSNVAIPSNLLIPLKKSIYHFALTDSSVRSISSNSGWGSFHMGFSSKTDTEPGRCRRTDGKKWRCSRDAVLDQKYCERHINRGRHRSRKPVEGQIGHTQTGTVVNSKLFPINSTSNGTTNELGTMPPEFKSLQPGGSSYDSSITNGNRLPQNQHGLSSMATSNLVSYEGRDISVKQEINLHESAQSGSGFGLVPTGSMPNPKSYGSFFNFNNLENPDQNLPYQLIDHYPKDYRTWSEELKSDWTQLSMSSHGQDKLPLLPLRLSQKLASGMPMDWETAIGGPLGEVLKNTANSVKVWDGSPQLESSPTGVLQLSNSSSGSSPRTENRIHGSAIARSSVPSLPPGSDHSM